MPALKPGRELVSKWLKEEGVSIQALANCYGLSRQEATNYINGSKVTPKGNRFILKVIDDFKIKQKGENHGTETKNRWRFKTI